MRARRRRADEPPRRIASFNVCADQLVIALADPDQIVALSPNARDPAISVVTEKAANYPLLGRTAEAMVPLKPDLVLVGPWDRPLTQRLLHVLGFRIVNVPLINDLATGIAQIRDIAKLVGHPERGEALIAEIEAARRRLAAAPRPKSSSCDAGRQQRLHRRPRKPRRRADARGRAGAAGGRARAVTAATCRSRS